MLGAPLRQHIFEEGCFDGAVELVHIGHVDSVLEPIILGAKPLYRRLVFLPLVRMALVQGVAHPLQDLIIECEPAKERAELVLEHLFPHIGFVAFSLVTGAVIVDVALLLDLCHDRTSAMAAFDQAGKGEVMLRPAVLASVAAIQHFLHPLPQIPRDQRLVIALMDPAAPLEFPHIEPVSKDLVHGAGGDGFPALAIVEPHFARLCRQVSQRHAARGIPLEQLDHLLGERRVGFVVTVADYSGFFEKIEDPYLRARTEDMRSLGRRILVHLQSGGQHPRTYPERCILMGEEVSIVQMVDAPVAQLVDVIALMAVAVRQGNPTLTLSLLIYGCGLGRPPSRNGYSECAVRSNLAKPLQLAFFADIRALLRTSEMIA